MDKTADQLGCTHNKKKRQYEICSQQFFLFYRSDNSPFREKKGNQVYCAGNTGLKLTLDLKIKYPNLSAVEFRLITKY